MGGAPREFVERDEASDRALRPKRFADFTGQRAVTRNLALAVAAARQRGEPLDHVLLAGPPGLGKTTLAHILAAEMGAEITETAGPLLEKPGDLAALLSALRPGSLLFIDEIHSLKRVVEEYLYAAMEDFRIAVHLGEGPASQVLTINLPPFTLVGATTREGSLTAPLRSRFAIRERLDLYGVDELLQILERSARLLGVAADAEGLRPIARRSRGTARIANNLLRRIRDLAQVHHGNRITAAVAEEGLAMLGIDEHGLTELDRRILHCLCRHRRPVGLKTIAQTVDEEETTIEEMHEPYLVQAGFLLKTAQGRLATPAAYRHLGLPPPSEPPPLAQQDLFA
ncbi:MAG: Holliday junction branch migration DNA helicase RuvB [Planctomycetes bacterium]|nr:Holliday junction branch migration DNA helicase RuvB [Planctomycetota bacterium]